MHTHAHTIVKLPTFSSHKLQVLGGDLQRFTREMAAYQEQQRHVEELHADLETILLSNELIKPEEAFFRCVCVCHRLCLTVGDPSVSPKHAPKVW